MPTTARSSKKAVVLCLFQSFAGMIFGWENSSTSGLYQLPAYLRRFGTCDTYDAAGACTNYSLPTTRQSTIAGILCIGAFLGALSSVSGLKFMFHRRLSDIHSHIRVTWVDDTVLGLLVSLSLPFTWSVSPSKFPPSTSGVKSASVVSWLVPVSVLLPVSSPFSKLRPLLPLFED
jgi:hypothetical protein